MSGEPIAAIGIHDTSVWYSKHLQNLSKVAYLKGKVFVSVRQLPSTANIKIICLFHPQCAVALTNEIAGAPTTAPTTFLAKFYEICFPYVFMYSRLRINAIKANGKAICARFSKDHSKFGTFLTHFQFRSSQNRCPNRFLQSRINFKL